MPDMAMERSNLASVLRFCAVFCLLTISTAAASQSIANSNKCFTKPDTLDGHEVYSTVNQQPEYPGGLPQFYKDVLKNLKNPKEKGKGSERIVFTFVIDAEGHVRNFCFIDPAGGQYDDQIDSLVSNLNNWSPGELYKRKVNVRMLVPMIVEWN
jgi:protein TonB